MALDEPDEAEDLDRSEPVTITRDEHEQPSRRTRTARQPDEGAAALTEARRRRRLRFPPAPLAPYFIRVA